MASVVSSQVARALLLLSDATVERSSNLTYYCSDSDKIDANEEVESESQISGQFYENGGSIGAIKIKTLPMREGF